MEKIPEQRSIMGQFTFVADGLATTHNCDFIRDEKFSHAYQKGIDTISDFRPDLNVQWRALTACWAASIGLKVEGDFIECGVNTGILSRTIMDYINFNSYKDRTFWLLDTFEGIPVELLSETEKAHGREKMNNKYLHGFDKVKKTFSEFDNVELIKGRVPDTLNQVKCDSIAYLSIDMNCVAPEIAAAEFFWDKITKGGVMLLDDYGFMAHHEQKLAFDKFAKEKGIMIYSSPTGQGIVIK